MKNFAAAAVTLLLLLGLGGGARADCNSTAFPVRGAANQLAAACTTTHLANQGDTCDVPQMASQLTNLCDIAVDAPGAMCCAAVLLTVEQHGCLCKVAEAAEFDLSDLSVGRVREWYKTCGGRRQSPPEDDASCNPGPPPPPPAAKPEAPSAWPLRLWLAVGLLCAAAIVATVFVILKLWLSRTMQAPIQCHRGEDQQVPNAATTGLQVTSDPGHVKPCAGDDAANANVIEAELKNTVGTGEEEAIPPLRVEWSQVARARLPAPAPFEPPPPVLLPPGTVIPVAGGPTVIIVPRELPPSVIAPPTPIVAF